jgi:hypothetical protein
MADWYSGQAVNPAASCFRMTWRTSAGSGASSSERRVDRLGRIGVDASGARQVLGQLPDGRRHQEARDQGEQDGQRQRAAGVGGAGRDRQRDRARRGHGGDRLEQDLAQPDGSRDRPDPVAATAASLSSRLLPKVKKLAVKV